MKKGRKKKIQDVVVENVDVPAIENPVVEELNEVVPAVSTTLTREQLLELLKKADPKCGRGGCLHEKHHHQPGNSSQDECHLCSCLHFIES